MTADGILAEGLFKRYGRGDKGRQALRDVSLSAPPGEICGILGPNGAGKTTLVRILCTMLKPDAGSVRIAGQDAVADPAKVRQLIGVVLGGDRGLYPRLTGRENLAYWAALYRLPMRQARSRTDELLELVGLAERGNQRVEQYSRGMKQRLHLARGMIGSPQVLFLDEPMLGLDPVGARNMHRLILSLRSSGITILLTTHDLIEAEKLCAQVMLLKEGQVIMRGTPGMLDLPLRVDIGGLDEVTYEKFRSLPGVVSCELHDSGDAQFGLSDRANAQRLVTAAFDAGAARISTQPGSLEDAYFAAFDGTGQS